MTSLPHPSLTVTVEAGAGTAHVRIAGDLDYGTGDEMIDHATRCLDAHPGLRELHLDCARLQFCDSTGVAALLMIHRRATAGGTDLRLDSPPPFLERILTTTGIRDLFRPAHPSQCAGQPPTAGR